MESKEFVKNLLVLLPYWHYTIDKPFKQSLAGKMTLESYYCLQTLRQDGALTMSELAQRLKISRQQATQTVNRLCECAFIRRLYDNSDRRCIKVEITAQAEKYIDQVYYQDTAFLDNLQRCMDKEDLQELAQAIETLLRILPRLKSEN